MDALHEKIVRSQPRETIRVTLKDGLILEGPTGTTIGEFLTSEASGYPYKSPLMGAVCDGQLRELTYPLYRDAVIAPVTLSNSDGGRMYRRSLVMLMATAAAELFDAQVSVRYAVPDGGYYCTRLNGGDPFTPEQIAQIEKHMWELVEQDCPITKRIVSLDEAVELFKARNDIDKLRLLEQRTRQDLTLYTLRDRDDYYYGYMVPSTGYLRYFKMFAVEDGFVLQYPVRENPTELQPLRAYEKLDVVFKQSDDWLKRLGLEDIGRLNRIVTHDNRIHEIILVAEALHEQRVAAIAGEIARRHHDEGVRLVLIAGPSSSGKTTFSKRLAIQLLAHSLRPFTLELDNYFVDRELTPRDANGEYDFEALEAINLKQFNEHLLDLTQNKAVQMPRFDFRLGKSVPGRTAHLTENEIIIIEGIHGLNPGLVPSIPPSLIHRVYVSALTQLNLDAHNRVPTTDVRLLRRIVRDARTRGYNAVDTLRRWESVRRGEKVNIFPHQENADSIFNSALAYELAALRPLVEPLLLQVEPGTPPHIEAKRLLSFLRWVKPLTPVQLDMVPDTSLLREFIGRSSLENYHPIPFDVMYD